jgi:TetR/AcrR family transcriptional regulator
LEHVHVAPRTGVVKAVGVKVGQQVAAGSVVVELDVEPSVGQAVDEAMGGRCVAPAAPCRSAGRRCVRQGCAMKSTSSNRVSPPRDSAVTAPPDTEGNATRALILAAARAEFSAKGLSGARVRQIAERAGVNKQLLYYYFGSKDDLYRAALEAVYAEIRELERGLHLGDLPPLEAMAALVGFSFDYLARHPDFIGMLNHENAHGACACARVERDPRDQFAADRADRATLKRGVAARVFRRGVDPVELYISIAGMSYFFFSNRGTLSSIFARDLAAPKREAAIART